MPKVRSGRSRAKTGHPIPNLVLFSLYHSSAKTRKHKWLPDSWREREECKIRRGGLFEEQTRTGFLLWKVERSGSDVGEEDVRSGRC